MVIKYGVESVINNNHKVTIYNDPEQAKAEAEVLGSSIGKGDTVLLFTAPCDDQTGKLASTQFNVVRSWHTD